MITVIYTVKIHDKNCEVTWIVPGGGVWRGAGEETRERMVRVLSVTLAIIGSGQSGEQSEIGQA